MTNAKVLAFVAVTIRNFSTVILDVFVATYLNLSSQSDHHKLRFYTPQVSVISGYFEEFWHFSNLMISSVLLELPELISSLRNDSKARTKL